MQLVTHKMQVKFVSPSGCDHSIQVVDCADIKESRRIGRIIAQWMANGVGFKVESETVAMEWR